METGIRMQIMAWHRKPVDVDKEKHPNNMNVNEIILVMLHSSEGVAFIIIFTKTVPFTVMTIFIASS